jgi:hypothetical protein
MPVKRFCPRAICPAEHYGELRKLAEAPTAAQVSDTTMFIRYSTAGYMKKQKATEVAFSYCNFPTLHLKQSYRDQ